ncbi:hypothetical protein J2X71_006223 [Rhizobium sp. 1399]|nr:hypothetical protein [Rhizobium sp. 1399]
MFPPFVLGERRLLLNVILVLVPRICCDPL